MFARVQLDLGADESVVVIPQSAVSFNPYGNAVFVVVDSEDNNGTAQKVVKRRFVRTGRTQGDYITILEGIEPGDTVATSGLLKLNNDTVIKIRDRKSTCLNSSHVAISYAVFCLKKKKKRR